MEYKIKNDEQLFNLHNIGRGFIFNYFTDGKTANKNNILHSADCCWVTKSNTNVKKYFFKTIKEAEEWLLEKIGKQDEKWKKCGTCSALGQSFLEDIEKILNKEIKVENNNENEDIFREPKVQKLLVNYLKQGGYNIKEKHKVSSGFIDIVADKDDEIIVIEVKGEDKGGYGSAEMNFQIGVGQILSRMTNKNAKYALAFPLTSNFKKVLKKYKKTSGFQNLNLFFYITKEDEIIECHTCESLIEMIDNL